MNPRLELKRFYLLFYRVDLIDLIPPLFWSYCRLTWQDLFDPGLIEVLVPEDLFFSAKMAFRSLEVRRLVMELLCIEYEDGSLARIPCPLSSLRNGKASVVISP
jgi:hypothetical protein